MAGSVSLGDPFPAPRMRAIDSATELAAAEAVAGAASRPEAVTALIAALFESLGGRPVTADAARALPAATREWLLQWSAARLRPGLRWFEACCEHCGEPYDLTVDLARPVLRLPDRAAATVTVETSLGSRAFAVPDGLHEEALAGRTDADPRRAFAAVCGQSPDAAGEAEQFGEHDLQLIDEALEAASPDIADTVSTVCPACGEPTVCRIDPLGFAVPREDDILRDVHLLASAYGWPRGDILRLSARQRAAHAGMILRDRPSRGRW